MHVPCHCSCHPDGIDHLRFEKAGFLSGEIMQDSADVIAAFAASTVQISIEDTKSSR